MFRKPYDQTIVKASPCGKKTEEVFRLMRDLDGNASYIKIDDKDVQSYINSFATGCSLKAILDRTQLVPARERAGMMQQQENGVGADLSHMPKDGTAAQIMLQELKRENPDLIDRLRKGESFNKIFAETYGRKAQRVDPVQPTPETVQKATSDKEVLNNG